MNPPNPRMNDLFAQLGLPNEEADIRDFVASHRPLPADQRLADAPFWNEAQRSFLRSQFLEDAEWVELIDQLNGSLHE